jgi:hypothetical protein
MSVEVKVPYIKQEDPRWCWNAAYKMMLKYQGKAETLADGLPHDKEMRERGIYDSEFPTCKNWLGLRSVDPSRVSTAQALEAQLYEFGPLWCAGYYCPDLSVKNGQDYKHVVVVTGVQTHWFGEAEVVVNDPYRGYIAQARPTTWSWSRFWVNLLKVPHNCQFWN